MQLHSDAHTGRWYILFLATIYIYSNSYVHLFSTVHEYLLLVFMNEFIKHTYYREIGL